MNSEIRLIFLHGGPGYPDYLEPFFANAFPREFKPLFYSQMQRDPIKIDDLVNELDTKVQAEKTPVILVGHSWGGVLAVEYYRRMSPLQVKGIVLIGSYLCGDDASTEYRRELEIRGLEDPTTEQVFLTPEEIEPSGDLIPRLKSSFNIKMFRSLWDGFAETYDARPFITLGQVPILNIFGDQDIRIPARKVRAYESLSPSVKNVEILGTAHFPFILDHHRKQVVKAIEEFVRQNQ